MCGETDGNAAAKVKYYQQSTEDQMADTNTVIQRNEAFQPSNITARLDEPK